MAFNITFTTAAVNYINKMLEKNNSIAFRLSIKKTGCSGYAYAPTLLEVLNESDIQFNIQNILVCVDPLWAHLLENINVDYIEEEKTGLKQKRLLFTNPNESSRCGCGESFHVEK